MPTRKRPASRSRSSQGTKPPTATSSDPHPPPPPAVPSRMPKASLTSAVTSSILTAQPAAHRAKQRKGTVMSHIASSITRDGNALFKTFQQAPVGVTPLTGPSSNSKVNGTSGRTKSQQRTPSVVSFQKRKKQGGHFPAPTTVLHQLSRAGSKPQGSTVAASTKELDLF